MGSYFTTVLVASETARVDDFFSNLRWLIPLQSRDFLGIFVGVARWLGSPN